MTEQTHYELVCLSCSSTQHEAARRCGQCGGLLGFRYRDLLGAWDERFAGSMWRYWRLLPVAEPSQAVTLGEGGTPLLRSRLLPDLKLYWKDESRNPTGSHKDRALAVAVGEARRSGSRVSVVVSAGSTGLSNAAYAARAGLGSVSLMSRGAPEGRIYPLAAYGSRLIEVDASIDEILTAAESLAAHPAISVASTTRAANPFQAEGAKTIAYEIAEQLGAAPDWMVVPVGGGGTIAALWRGFLDLQQRGAISSLPRLAGVVPEAYDALAAAYVRGIDSQAAFAALPYLDDVPTVLSKLSHAHPPDGLEALAAIRASRGIVISVGDTAAIDSTLQIAQHDGLYFEPSSAVVVPALRRLRAAGTIATGAIVVALGCGSGFRETFVLQCTGPARRECASLTGLAEAIETWPEAEHPRPPPQNKRSVL